MWQVWQMWQMWERLVRRRWGIRQRGSHAWPRHRVSKKQTTPNKPLHRVPHGANIRVEHTGSTLLNDNPTLRSLQMINSTRVSGSKFAQAVSTVFHRAVLASHALRTSSLVSSAGVRPLRSVIVVSHIPLSKMARTHILWRLKAAIWRGVWCYRCRVGHRTAY